MLVEDVIKELARIKGNCMNISDDDCIQGSCPYHGHCTQNEFSCMFEDWGLNMPCEWEIPIEV